MQAYFKTDEFRQELNDDEIDRVVLGQDCIHWLHSQLDAHDDVAAERPIFEDWGWTMAVSVKGSQLWLNVQDWSFEESQTWRLWLEPRGVVAAVAAKLTPSRHKAASMRLRRVIDEALSGAPAIHEVRWIESKSA